MTKLVLPLVTSDEEYDRLNLNDDVFKDAAREIIVRHNLPDATISLLAGTNIVFSYGGNRIIKMFPPTHHSQFMSETLVMKHLYNKLPVSTPAIEFEGAISGWPYIIMSRLKGVPLEGLWEKLDHQNKVIIMRELGSLIRQAHSLPTQGLEAIDCHWEQFIAQQINQCVAKHKSTNLPNVLLEQIPKYIESMVEYLPTIKKPVILTGEYTPMNLLVTQISGIWHIEGLIDFGDAMLGLPEYDLLGPGAFLIQGDEELLKEFLLSYGYSQEDLTDKLSHQLTLLMLLHRYSNLNVQIRIENWKEKVSSIHDLEKLVWGTHNLASINNFGFIQEELFLNVKIKGNNYLVSKAGKGIPCLLICLGTPSFRTLSKEFADMFEVYSSDVYWGSSEVNIDPNTFTMETIIDDIKALGDALNLNKYIIFAHSAYGIVALEFAKKYPNIAQGIIMVGTPVNSNLSVLKENNLIFELKAEPIRKAIDTERRKQIEKENLNKLTTEKRWLREYVYRDAARYWHNPSFDCTDLWKGVHFSQLFTILFTTILPNTNVLQDLEKITTPIFLAVGVSDYDCCPWMWKEVSNLPNNFIISIFNQSGHWPHYEEPVLFDSRVKEWMKSIFILNG